MFLIQFTTLSIRARISSLKNKKLNPTEWNRFFKEHYPPLSIPLAELKIEKREGLVKVFDRIRKNYFHLTDEEFVRQNFVAWMIDEYNYPPSIIANEIGIDLNGTKKRCDTVVFSPNGSPFIIVEYKSPFVKITQEVFNQIVRYNMVLKARYLIVSNGVANYCCEIDYDNHSYRFLDSIPKYDKQN